MQDLIEQYKLLHKKKRGYGKTGESLVPVIAPFVTGKRVLDYGCGKSKLVDLIRCEGYKYDPAIPEYSYLPTVKLDYLITTDVLEHIPYKEIDGFIVTLRRLCNKQIHAISLRPSGNKLPDGRPCHLIVEPKEWWINKMKQWFRKVDIIKHFKSAKKVVLQCTKY